MNVWKKEDCILKKEQKAGTVFLVETTEMIILTNSTTKTKPVTTVWRDRGTITTRENGAPQKIWILVYFF